MPQDQFSWIPFYKEFANKLLKYRYNRKELLDYIYNTLDANIGNLHEEDGRNMDDICPFTTMGIFNRGTTFENRQFVAKQFKEFLSIKAEVPTKFEGIPTLNNQKSNFFGFSDKRAPDDIENLWNLFEKALESPYDIEHEFNVVRSQYIIKVNITMALYWILPEKFIALDSRNRNYLLKYGINVKNQVPEFSDYFKLIQNVQNKMQSGEIKEKSFPEFSYSAWLNGNEDSSIVSVKDNPYWEYWEEIINLLHYKRNIILQGAPGTGKTYDIAEIVVRLCSYSEVIPDRKSIMQEYKDLAESGRVMFTTFHQSMDYEEFVEGLKPELIEGAIHYAVSDGIFKQINKKALLPIVENINLGIRENPTIWKVSLMTTYDNPVRTDCLKNNRIRIGWDQYGAEVSEDTNYEYGGRIVLDTFINKMQIGDIVMSCYTNKIVDAIGVITGEYVWDDKLTEYKRTRAVKWLIKGIEEDIYEINKKTAMTLSTVYRLNNISLENVMDILKKHKIVKTDSVIKNDKPHVLIIDEINRGNISKIFGELITLLEADKRLGEENEIKATLPYSKEELGIASNLFIIGTMNTADRSLGFMDYAIRRRFAFVELSPYELDADGFNVDIFRIVCELFIKDYDEYINDDNAEPSIYLSDEFLPKDVMIGHSYFIMEDKNGSDITDLRLNYEIIPILKEYLKDGVFKDKVKVEKVIEELTNYQSIEHD